MVKFIIPSHLFELMDSRTAPASSSMTEVSLSSGPWNNLVREIREQFPKLAKHVLTESDDLAPGFILAVNDEVIRSGYSSLHFSNGDEFSIIAAMAGG